MMTIEVALEEPLVTKLDNAASTLAVTRADLIRDAVEAMLRRIEIKVLEEQHRRGYERFPVTPEEFGIWEAAPSKRDIKQLERQDREGYERHPITPEEFGDWEAVRDWGPE